MPKTSDINAELAVDAAARQPLAILSQRPDVGTAPEHSLKFDQGGENGMSMQQGVGLAIGALVFLVMTVFLRRRREHGRGLDPATLPRPISTYDIRTRLRPTTRRTIVPQRPPSGDVNGLVADHGQIWITVRDGLASGPHDTREIAQLYPRRRLARSRQKCLAS